LVMFVVILVHVILGHVALITLLVMSVVLFLAAVAFSFSAKATLRENTSRMAKTINIPNIVVLFIPHSSRFFALIRGDLDKRLS